MVADDVAPDSHMTHDPLDVDGCMKTCPVVAPSNAYQAVFRVRPTLTAVRRSPVPSCACACACACACVCDAAVRCARGVQSWPSQTAVDVGRVTVQYRMQFGEYGTWTSPPLVARVSYVCRGLGLSVLLTLPRPSVARWHRLPQTPPDAPLALSWLDVPQEMHVATTTAVARWLQGSEAACLRFIARLCACVCVCACVRVSVSLLSQVSVCITNNTAAPQSSVQLVYDNSKDCGVVLEGITTQVCAHAVRAAHFSLPSASSVCLGHVGRVLAQAVGPIAAGDSVTVPLTLLALRPGWHQLNFLSLATSPDTPTLPDDSRTPKTNATVLVLP